jgi:hypothetical protein
VVLTYGKSVKKHDRVIKKLKEIKDEDNRGAIHEIQGFIQRIINTLRMAWLAVKPQS